MINLKPEELDRLKLLFSELNPQKPSALPKRTLTMEEKIFTLNILRENFPNLFFGLTEEQLKDNNFLLKHLSNPYNRHKIRDTLRKELSKLSVAQQNELAEILEEEPVGTEKIAVQSTGEAPQADQPIPPTGGSMPGGLPTMPTAPYISTPRIFRNVPQAPETPKPDIAIANKSGYVAEKPPSEFYVTDKSGNITGVYSKEPISAQGVEAPQSKIFVANSSGVVTGEHKITPASAPTTPISSSKRFNFSSFKSSLSSGFNKVKNFASRANPFLKTNLGRITNGLKGMAGGLGSGAAQTGGRALGGLTNMANSRNFGGVGSNSIFGKISRVGKGGSGSVRSLAGNVKKRSGLMFVFGIIFFMLLVGAITTISQPSQPGEASPIGGGGNYAGANISSCKFTRNGNSLQIKSSTLVGYINQAAASIGIPAQILASIAMHENADITANKDNTDPAIQSNQFCSPGKQLCEKNGQVLHSIEGEDDPCTQEEKDNGAKTAQAIGLMQNLDIYNQGKDLCSITGSLSIAAAKLKADGVTSAPTEEQVKKAISAYYNGCTYGSYNYCSEVWQDLQNCQTTASTITIGGDFANQLVNKIQQSPSCKGIITRDNVISCLASIQPIPQLAYQEILDSATKYLYLQCVGFVQAIIGGLTGNPLQMVANGKAYTQAPPPAGYKFISKNTPGVTIKMGDIAVWSKGIDGHIAYVVDPGTNIGFVVAEANSGGDGVVRTRPATINEPHFEGWAIKQ